MVHVYLHYNFIIFCRVRKNIRAVVPRRKEAHRARGAHSRRRRCIRSTRQKGQNETTLHCKKWDVVTSIDGMNIFFQHLKLYLKIYDEKQ